MTTNNDSCRLTEQYLSKMRQNIDEISENGGKIPKIITFRAILAFCGDVLHS